LNGKNPLRKHHGSFSTIESNLKEYPIIGFDSEDDSKGTPLLFTFYGDFKKKKFMTRHWDEALDFIYSIEEPTIFVAHNLEYDVANLFKAEDYLMVEELIYASRLLKVSLYGTKHFMINSLCFFAGTLKKMGEFIGLEKYDGHALDEKYAMRDAEIVYTFMKKFQKKLVSDIGVNLGITIGQMAMSTYRRSYMLDKTQTTYNSPNCLKAYYGGRVEIFHKGAVKDISVSDINSCYPYVMKNRVYPDTSNIEPSSIDTHEFGIGKFKVNVPDSVHIPVLPYKSGDSRLFFPTGTFTGWWTYAEVRHAVENGAEILKEYEGEGTNSGCRPFKNFIGEFYDRRLVSKKILKKDPNNSQASFDSLFYKLWQNNLYGKWCQWRPGAVMTRDPWPDWKLNKWIDNPEFKTCKIGPFYSYTVPKIEPPKTANFLWGIYVTSYARIYLHQAINNIHNAGHTVLYCDTDSVMYQRGKATIPLEFSQELGDWDKEDYDLGVFRQAKGYLLCNKTGKNYEIEKVACKGVPTHLAYDFIIDGMAHVMKPMRLKEALIRTHADVNKGDEEFLKDIGENIWTQVTKEMRSIYIKRLGENGPTRPVNVKEIPALEACAIQDKISIKQELKDNEIQIKKPVHKNAFENTVVPAGYFEGKRKNAPDGGLYLSQKIFRLTKGQCIELRKGDIWFVGHILQAGREKSGHGYYKLFLENFKGKKVPVNLWARIWKSFFTDYLGDENLIDKKVAVSLASDYIKNSSLDLRIKISKSKFKGQFEAEIPDEEELNEKELKNLMSLDWSKIKCPQ